MQGPCWKVKAGLSILHVGRVFRFLYLYIFFKNDLVNEVSFFSSESKAVVANSAMKWGASKTKNGTVHMITQMLQNSEQFWRGLVFKTTFQTCCKEG